jgi:hypothetical protein
MGASTPLTEAARGGASIWLPSLEELRARYPAVPTMDD